MKEKKQTEVDQAARLLFVLLRYDMDLDQAQFAAATRTSPSQVSVYDRGGRTVPEAVLERAADARGFPRVLLQPARRAIRSFRAAARGWSRANRALAETFFAELLALGNEALEVITEAAMPEVNDREEAADLWARLERWSSRQRMALVEEDEEFQTLELSELVAAKSAEKAMSNPVESQELARLAVRIAELCPGHGRCDSMR